MTRVVLVVLLACACSKPRREETPPPVADPKAAAAAAEAKQYARCAELYLAVAASTRGEAMAAPLYDAACCQAQDGKPDAAFATLERAIAAGFHGPGIETDPDLASLHADPRWQHVEQAIAAATAAAERAVSEPALRSELLDLQQQDATTRAGDDDAIAAFDARSTARMKEIIAKHGWPGKSLVGKDGAHAAWLLVQHSRDAAFQEDCLERLELAVAQGEAQAVEHAYLYDRVAVAAGKPQRYGTQLDGDVPFPIEDAAHVDDRRKALGLPSMADAAKQLQQLYDRP